MEVTWQASDYYAFVVMMCLLTGLTFQFPLALIILMWLELVRPRTLLKSWRGMLFGFYLAAVGVGTVIVRRKRVARGDKPNPEDDDLPDDDEDDDGDRPNRSADPVKPSAPALGSSATSKPKSTPPPAEGDLSSLD